MFRYLIHWRLGIVEVTANHIFTSVGLAIYFLISTIFLTRKGYSREMILKFHLFTIAGAIVTPVLYLLGVWGYRSFRFQGMLEMIILLVRSTDYNKFWIGGGIMSFIYLWLIRKLPRIWNFYDHLFPSLAFLFGWFKTFGCFVYGCCFGRPTRMPWGVVFPPYTQAYKIYGELPLHPVQIYNTIGAWIIMGIGLWLLKRKEFDGEVVLWMLFMGSAAKVFEALFGRGDLKAVDRVFPLAIPPLVISFLLLVYYYVFYRKDRVDW